MQKSKFTQKSPVKLQTYEEIFDRPNPQNEAKMIEGKKLKELDRLIKNDSSYTKETKLIFRKNLMKSEINVWNMEIKLKNGDFFFILTDRGERREFKNLNKAFEIGKKLGYAYMGLI